MSGAPDPMPERDKAAAAVAGIVVFFALLVVVYVMRTYHNWADTPRGPVIIETAATVEPAEWATLDTLAAKAALNSGAVNPHLIESRYRPRDGIATLILKGSHETDGTICMAVKATHYRGRLSGKWFDDVDPYARIDRVECPS